MIFDEYYTLSNGVTIPKLALGTWFIHDGYAAKVIPEAVKIGYRHFDSAQAYGNEHGVGEGVRSCGVPRNQIFVTSKVAAEHKDYTSAASSIDESLRISGLDYFDLMLIHSPQPWTEVNQSDNRHYEENREVWRALEDACRAGKVRAIGVSNFEAGDIDNILESCSVRPMVNQVLAHITNTPFALLSYCKDQNILVEAHSPIAHGQALKNPQIREMAEKYGVSPSQLCIRYDLQLGMVALPKTGNFEHMKENASVDFVISDEDMDILKNLPHIKNYGRAGKFPVYGGKIK